MKTTIETLTLIRDHIRNVLLPTAQGKTPGKWGASSINNLIYKNDWTIGDMDCNEYVAEDCPIVPEEEQNHNAHFIAATSNTAEPAWLCVAEEIDELLPTLRCNEHIAVGDILTSYARMRAASIINNWKGVIQ